MAIYPFYLLTIAGKSYTEIFWFLPGNPLVVNPVADSCLNPGFFLELCGPFAIASGRLPCFTEGIKFIDAALWIRYCSLPYRHP